MTVESTSKQTASALAKLSMAPAMSVPWNEEARSPKWARISSPVGAAAEESVDVDEYTRRGAPEEVTRADAISAAAATGEAIDEKAAMLWVVAQAAALGMDDADAGPALRARVRRTEREAELTTAGFMGTINERSTE
jgi:hypothetical protein